MRRIELYDTTLRDGSQSEGISFSLHDKLQLTARLDSLGFDYVEGGYPASNEKDAQYFQRVGNLDLKQIKVCAFGMTRRKGTKVADDPGLKALLASAAATITIVGKSSAFHAVEVLHTTLEENLLMIAESVRHLRAAGREVIYDAEHFFDGYRADSAYALATLRAAWEGGADSITLCDTNGGGVPWQIEESVQAVRAQFPGKPFGIHTHNDGGCGVANTLAAVRVGCNLVQGTINGYGERCGNADLCSIIPNLELKMGMTCLPPGRLMELTNLSRAVAEIGNLAPDTHQAFVGHSAFAHKGGIHVAAQRRNVLSYQHIDPTLVGNELRVVVSELSGRGNVLSRAEELGLEANAEYATNILQRIKEMESRGFHFESADASVELMMRRAQPNYHPPFELLDFMVVVEHRAGRGLFAEGNVKLRVQGEVVHTVSEGNGPVNALDYALRKALRGHYPAIDSFHLADYKVRILDGGAGTGATTRVLIETANHQERWNTVGASPNIIEASWLALFDAVEYGLSVAKN
jgi:2-isopropylmalate synthase